MERIVGRSIEDSHRGCLTDGASPVNELTILNAATTKSPGISATGNDTDIGITLTPKGAGKVLVGSNEILTVAGGTMTGDINFTDTNNVLSLETEGLDLKSLNGRVFVTSKTG